ncbi:MAG: hypothetical protein HY303_17365 [Candidatus Wallbacteria bacterium]|nr:hypothetical protein [Candidatus Wallbacteria bacterium]
MFAAAFIGLTVFSLSLMARFGASVPQPLLVYGWRLFGLALLSVGGVMLFGASAAAEALGSMTMLTFGAHFVSVG